MNSNSTLSLLIFLSLILIASRVASNTTASELVGTWTLSIQTPRGLNHPTLEVVETDGVYSGTYNSARGPLQIKQITIEGDQFEFPLVISIPIGDISVQYRGSVSGNEISGLVINPRGEVPFRGVRN